MTYADAFNLRTANVKFNDVADAIDGVLSRGSGNVTTGSATAYAVAPSPAWQSYEVFRPLWFTAHAANTGAATLAVSGLAAVPVHFCGRALVGGELVALGESLVVYDGGVFNLLNHAGGSAAYTPAWTPTGGMTFGSFTKNEGFYRRHGDLVWFSAAAAGTTGGSASSRIDVSLPAGLGTVGDAYLPAVIYDGSYAAGFTIPTGAATLGVSKASGANFGLGAGRQVFVSGWVRVT